MEIRAYLTGVNNVLKRGCHRYVGGAMPRSGAGLYLSVSVVTSPRDVFPSVTDAAFAF